MDKPLKLYSSLDTSSPALWSGLGDIQKKKPGYLAQMPDTRAEAEQNFNVYVVFLPQEALGETTRNSVECVEWDGLILVRKELPRPDACGWTFSVTEHH